ncbi:hypothetical protein FQN57_005073 [Myotisia sp. PD_48]|nr:hypothetical protein FQN57_005073 [Myotisia sp. PD_48]
MAPDPNFTVFVRLPFPRGEFVDPPVPNWDATKDKVLWDVLSQPSKENDTDWKALSEEFDVTLPFLLQQAAWLYERQLSQVRAQIKKVGGNHPNSGQSSVGGTTPGGGQPMNRCHSEGSQVPPRISNAPLTPNRTKFPTPQPSSSNSGNHSPAPRTQEPRSHTTLPRSSRRSSAETAHGRGRRESRSSGLPHPSLPSANDSTEYLSSSISSSSDSDSSDNSLPGYKRFGKFSIHHKPTRTNGGYDDEDDAPAFLPFESDNATIEETPPDPSATLREIQDRDKPKEPGETRETENEISSSNPKQTAQELSTTSSNSSGVAVISPPPGSRPRPPRVGTLSPQLAKLSPAKRASLREGSDGTPSMGSSFSELDDASVSQSALEEALLSNIQHASIAGRMSTISQALRSKYL